MNSFNQSTIQYQCIIKSDQVQSVSPSPLYHKINLTPVKVVRGLFKSKSNISKNQTESRKVVRVFSSPVCKANE